MRVSLDDGVTWLDAEKVRIEEPNSTESGTCLSVCVTPEGMLLNNWENAQVGRLDGTASFQWEDMKEWCI